MTDFILSFYEGLSPTDRSWADAASGGSFLDRSPEDGIDLIERKAVDNQQYGTRENSCGICISTDHYTDECPSLMETTVETSSQAFAANTFGGNRPYKNYHDSSSNRYQQNMQPYVPLQQRQPYVPPQQRHQPQPEMSLLRTGKQVQGPEVQEDEDKKKEEEQVDDNGGPNEPSPETTTEKSRLVPPNSSSKKSSSSYSPPPPYPNRLKLRNKKIEELDQEILNIFKKVEINIPLLDVVKQIPKYAKFLKEICTNRRRFKDKEVVNLGRNVSSLIKKNIEIPRKCKDPEEELEKEKAKRKPKRSTIDDGVKTAGCPQAFTYDAFLSPVGLSTEEVGGMRNKEGAMSPNSPGRKSDNQS
ncbi:uncharacterized protein LOC106778319 [Vigna radiata var. radiata]|uniref:Uncharacterized protein LOC106778319 n=1 Tax=Vigna radiata var. radiata TaxID=3916 RepID=A0A1S3VU92_VIGRR|nr:uncharacterized protein LOC106778319 [Vigna radiata var. radiata]